MSQNACGLKSNHSLQQKASPMTPQPSIVGIDLAKRIAQFIGICSGVKT
jgi:hypothetical protein